jgi:hypothetical protein
MKFQNCVGEFCKSEVEVRTHSVQVRVKRVRVRNVTPQCIVRLVK